MVYAVKLNAKEQVISVNVFEKQEDVPKELLIYTGNINPEKLLLKTKQELGL